MLEARLTTYLLNLANMDKIGYSWSMRRASKFIRDNSPKPRWYETGEINQVESENGDYVVYKLKFL